MTTKIFKIADKVVEVASLYEKVHEYCKDYETNEPADYSITITREDIAYEKRKTASVAICRFR